MSDHRLDELLLNSSLLDERSLSHARAEAIARQRKLAEIVIDLGLVDQRTLAELIARKAGIPLASPIDMSSVQSIAGRFPTHLARKHVVVPVEMTDETIVVAMIDPFEPGLVEVLESTTGMTIRRAAGVRSEVEMAVIEVFGVDEQAEITLFSSRSLSLDLATEAEAREMVQTPDEVIDDDVEDDGSRTIVVKPMKTDADESTAPAAVREQTDSSRIAHVEKQLLNVSRVLAIIQTRIDAIDAKITRLVDSTRASR